MEFLYFTSIFAKENEKITTRDLLFCSIFFTFSSDDGSWVYLREYNKLTIVDRIMNYGTICYELTKIIGLPPIIRSLNGEFLVIPNKFKTELSPSLLYWCKDLNSCSQGIEGFRIRCGITKPKKTIITTKSTSIFQQLHFYKLQYTIT